MAKRKINEQAFEKLNYEMEQHKKEKAMQHKIANLDYVHFRK